MAWLGLSDSDVLQFLLHATTVAVTAGFALALAFAARRNRVYWFLVAFLAFIAVNFAAEAWIALEPGAMLARILARIALIAAAVDPFLLYYFASVYPTRSKLNARPLVALVGMASVVFVVAAFWVRSPLSHVNPEAVMIILLGWEVFTFVTYGVVFVHFSRVALRGTDPASGWGLFAAAGIALFPLPGRVIRALWLAFPAPFLGAGDFTFNLEIIAYLVLLAVGSVVVARWIRPRFRSTYWQGVMPGVGLTILIYHDHLLKLGPWLRGEPPPYETVFGNLFSVAGALRWITISYLVAGAVTRDDVLHLGLRTRRIIARVMMAITIVVVAAGVSAVAPVLLGAGPYLAPTELLLLVVVLLAIVQWSPRVVDRVATVVYRLPSQAPKSQRLAAYHHAAIQALEEQRDLESHQALRDLADELDLEPADALTVRLVAQQGVNTSLVPGTLIGGKYRLVRQLGVGQQGQTYLADDVATGTEVVIKRLNAPTVAQGQSAATEAEIASVAAEAGAVAVLDVVEAGGAIYMVMEHVQGGSLADHVMRAGLLRVADIERIVIPLLESLDAVHRKGIIHRDIKPSNVLLRDHGAPVLADFGVARLEAERTIATASPLEVVGTLPFMAPEVRRGHWATRRSDLYSVAALIQATFDATALSLMGPALDRALREDASERPGSARRLASEIRRCVRA